MSLIYGSAGGVVGSCSGRCSVAVHSSLVLFGCGVWCDERTFAHCSEGLYLSLMRPWGMGMIFPSGVEGPDELMLFLQDLGPDELQDHLQGRGSG